MNQRNILTTMSMGWVNTSKMIKNMSTTRSVALSSVIHDRNRCRHVSFITVITKNQTAIATRAERSRRDFCRTVDSFWLTLCIHLISWVCRTHITHSSDGVDNGAEGIYNIDMDAITHTIIATAVIAVAYYVGRWHHARDIRRALTTVMQEMFTVTDSQWTAMAKQPQQLDLFDQK